MKHLEDQQILLIKSINNLYRETIAKMDSENKEIFYSTQKVKEEI